MSLTATSVHTVATKELHHASKRRLGEISTPLIWCIFALTNIHTSGRSELIVSGLTAPIFLAPDPHPAAVLAIGSISKEYARRGYFRIGVLPELIIDSVTLHIRNPSEIARVLHAVKVRTKPLIPEKEVRIQNVCLKADYEGRRIIVAAQMKDLGKLRWHFLDGVVSGDGIHFLAFEKAWLSVSGFDVGQVIAVSGQQTNLVPFFTTPPDLAIRSSE